MSQEWYYTANGEQHGPISAVEMKKLAQAGTITVEDLVWKEGMPNWVPAKNIKGLFGPAGGTSGETKRPDTVKPTEDKPAKAVQQPAEETPRTEKTANQPAAEEKPAEPKKKSTGGSLSDRLASLQGKSFKDKSTEDEDEEEEQPKARRRSRDQDDDDDVEEEERPRRRRSRDDDDDDDDRPSSRRRSSYDDDEDDYDDAPRSSRGRRQSGGTGLGMSSMIVGIVSIVLTLLSCLVGTVCFFAGFGYIISGIGGIVAVCLGFPALKTPGRGYAIAGLITGGLSMLVSIVIPLLLIIGVGAFLALN